MEIDHNIYSTVIFPLPWIQPGKLSVTGNSTEVGLSLPRNSVVKLTDCPTMTIAVYHGHKANKRIYHWSPMHTKKSQPEGKRIMPETRFTKFPALSLDARVRISWSASETED